MKTDRFADSIRRKLDSIRPEFSERDWVQMQAALKQAGPNPTVPTSAAHPFASHVSRYAVAGAIGTAIFLTTSIWQHYELNRLHQTLEQVTQKVNRPAVTDSVVALTGEANRELGVTNAESVLHAEPLRDGQLRVPVQPDAYTPTEHHSSADGATKRDTVYMDRYVTVPASAMRLRTTDGPSSASQYERSTMGNRTAQTDFSTSPVRTGNATRNRLSRQTGTNISESGLPTPSSTIAQQQNDSLNAEKPAENVVTMTRPTKNQDRGSGIDASPKPVEKMGYKGASSATPTGQITNRTSSGAESSGRPTTRGSSSGNASTNMPDNRVVQTLPIASNVPPNVNSAETAQPALGYETLASLPMQLSTVHWNELMAQRARRMRPARTTVVGGVASAAPAIQRVQPTPLRFRVGVSADIDSRIRSVGVYSELVLLKHWSLGVGLSQARFATNSFPAPPDFDRTNPQDFRRQYARGKDPRLAIFNIQQYSTRIQVPINLGYRIPLSSSWTLQPTVGTSLNLQNWQHISFYQELPLKLGYEQFTNNSIRPVGLFNTMTFGTSLEWQQKHWVAQAGPLVTAPLQEDPSCQQTVTVGLRARVLYQF